VVLLHSVRKKFILTAKAAVLGLWPNLPYAASDGVRRNEKTMATLTAEEIMKKTDHLFDEKAEPHKLGNEGPECFLLQEQLHLLYNELNAATSVAAEKKIALMIRAVVSRSQALGCTTILQP
jgi:hypothetical protein